MTTIIPYWRHSKTRSCIELSVELAQRNIPGEVLVVGDNPKIKGVDYLSMPRISNGEYKRRYQKNLKQRKAVDAVMKLLAAVESNRVTDTFVRIYDDTYVTRPVTIEELSIYRLRGRVEPSNRPAKGYLELRRQTFLRLKESGFPTNDYGNHMPVVFDKEKLTQTIERFNLIHEPGLTEIFYQNQHPAETVKSSSQWFRFASCHNDLDKLPTIITVHNTAAEKVTKFVREQLQTA